MSGGRAPIRPYGGVDFHGPKPGTPARAAALARHVNNLSSPNLGRQQGARHSLERMNLTPTEHMYVQSKVHEHQQGLYHAANDAQVKAARQQIQHDLAKTYSDPVGQVLGDVGHSIAHHAHDFKNYFVEGLHTSPLLGDLGNKEQARRSAEMEREAAPYAKAVLPQSAFDLAEGKLPSLKAAGEDAAFFLPGSRLLRGAGEAINAARIAEEGGRAAEAVRAGTQSYKEGKGVLGGYLENRRAVKLARRGAPRDSRQAVGHVLATAKKAKQEGFGRMLPKVPLLKPGEVSKETAGAAGAAVRQGLKNVGHERNLQESARAIERSKRAGAVEAVSQGQGGVARHIAAKAKLEGSLPAGSFKGFQGEVSENIDHLVNHVYDHPHFQPFEKVRASDALLEGVKGKVPTKSDQKLLERAFGKEKASGMVAAIKTGSFEKTIANIANVPRALMASGDLSAPFRQGLMVAASHPRIFFSDFGPMLKSLKSESDFQGLMHGIHQMPTYPLMDKGGVAFTGIGESAKAGAADLSKREEQFASNLAERIPGIGRVVRGSDRAYTGFLNVTRAKLFDHLVHQAAEQGYHLTGEHGDKLLQDIGRFVNSATGRGDIGALAQHTASMNALFFSPRLLYSRLNFLGFGGAGKWSWIPGSYYMSMEPFARRQALKGAMRLVGTLSTILFLAKMAGASVNDDPRNADFGKIRIGNTRIDLAGSFQQPIRLLAQLGSGQVVSSTTGKLEHLSGGFAGRSRLDVLQQFAQGKLAPVPSTITDLLKGSQFAGQPLSAESEALNHLVPLLWQDMYAIERSTGAKGLAAYGPEDLFGVGVQNYAPFKKKVRGTPSYSGGGQYGGSGEYGGSGSYSGTSGAYG